MSCRHQTQCLFAHTSMSNSKVLALHRGEHKIFLNCLWGLWRERECTRAAPSIMMTSHSGLESGRTMVSSRMPTRSDFFPGQRFPASLSAAGKDWFSCLKNADRSQSRAWQDIKICENRLHSLFSTFVPLSVEATAASWRKKSVLFFLMDL